MHSERDGINEAPSLKVSTKSFFLITNACFVFFLLQIEEKSNHSFVDHIITLNHFNEYLRHNKKN